MCVVRSRVDSVAFITYFTYLLYKCYTTILYTGSGAVSEVWRPRTDGEQFLSAWRPRAPIRDSFRVCESMMQISCRSPIAKLKNASAVLERHKPFSYIYIFTPLRPKPRTWCLSSGPERGASALNAQGAPRPRGGHCPHSLRPPAHSSLRAHCQAIDERPLRAMDTDGVEITGQKGDDTMRKAPHARFDCVVRPTPPSAPRPPHLATTTPIRRAARLPPALFHAQLGRGARSTRWGSGARM